MLKQNIFTELIGFIIPITTLGFNDTLYISLHALPLRPPNYFEL